MARRPPSLLCQGESFKGAEGPALPPRMQKSLAQVCMARRSADGVCVRLSESSERDRWWRRRRSEHGADAVA